MNQPGKENREDGESNGNHNEEKDGDVALEHGGLTPYSTRFRGCQETTTPFVPTIFSQPAP
jgi:hypothetical protein